ncbi:MAG: hypothetical protein IKZ45_07415 [Fibrobacter sp.]|nr:hypothetical protein [Fibrobacter sp.]MBR5412924.1 hypothetical protein [Fibrobacter sp.]
MASENTFLDHGVIEVPPELRGPSNEEILQKEGRKDTAMRRRAAARPSKRERMRRKLGEPIIPAKAPQKATKPHFTGFSAKVAAAPEAPAHKSSRLSFARKKLETLFSAVTRKPEEPEIKKIEPKREPPKLVPPPVPPSGRVLRGSFGAKPSDNAHAQVYSASELAKIRMEERAKKIRAELARKNGPAPLVDENGQPVKRPRGRPRKNP